jgi:pantoate--beta-alanine ligase
MFIFKRVPHLQDWMARQKQNTTTLGFVPTMGALHEGHSSLIRECNSQCDLTLVSLFVNPLQFNDPEDLKKYPRPIEADIELTYHAGTDVLFHPEVREVYPDHDLTSFQFDPGPLGEIMEGKFRPGHFKGVAEVVYRLLRIVNPDKIFLGQKDFQQVAVITKLISDKNLPVEVIVCPTLREANGLAMSSRNTRLSEKARMEAGLIYQTLQQGQALMEQGVIPTQIAVQAMNIFRKQNWDPEYFELIDGYTLKPIEDSKAHDYIVACCAVKVEGVRLIDNVIYKKA